MPFVNPKQIEAEANARANKINYLAQKRVLKVETAAEAAVRSAFKIWCQKAPLADRQAFMEALKQHAKGIAVDRIDYFASLMTEYTDPKDTKAAAAETEVAPKASKVERSAPAQAGEVQH